LGGVVVCTPLGALGGPSAPLYLERRFDLSTGEIKNLISLKEEIKLFFFLLCPSRGHKEK
jgi:hypothetical protein